MYGGSSPRMRGALMLCVAKSRRAGIIPANAGSTVPRLPYQSSNRDHPRGCGEHPTACSTWTSPAGSSPRMRGAHAKVTHVERDFRIIPADAGSTMRLPVSMCASWDHPRGCGERLAVIRHGRLGPGSSPRMRGALPGPVGVGHRRRIIPADAGSTKTC